jgi:hypothetical protein
LHGSQPSSKVVDGGVVLVLSLSNDTLKVLTLRTQSVLLLVRIAASLVQSMLLGMREGNSLSMFLSELIFYVFTVRLDLGTNLT